MSETELDYVAEALWQAESVRATDARRRSNWSDESEATHERWRFMARAAVIAYRRSPVAEGGGWRTIDSAPKDGTLILVGAENGWAIARHTDSWDVSWSSAPMEPTHWQPLPPPPVTDDPCAKGCQYAKDVGMPESKCANGCLYAPSQEGASDTGEQVRSEAQPNERTPNPR